MRNGQRNSQFVIRNSVAPTVELHIDELVLDGFVGIDQAQVGAAVQRELARLLAAGGLPVGWGRQPGETHVIPTLDAGSFSTTTSAGSEGIGVQIARAVHGGLNQ